MRDLDLVSKNLWRKPLRTILLLVSIFMAFLIFTILVGFNFAYERTLETTSLANRLVVSNKINFTQPLPIAYLNRVAQVDGVVDYTHQSWMGAYFQDQARSRFVGFAVEPESFVRVFADQLKMPDDQKKAFISERTGMIVGKTVADLYGWKVGQTVPISSDIFSQTNGRSAWDMKIVGIFSGPNPADNTSVIYANYAYFNETRTFGRDQIGQIAVLTASSNLNDRVAQAIDAGFANSPSETSTVDEKSFSRAFLAQAGDLNFIIGLVVGAAFLAILMIVGNTMVTAVRERTKEIGVMKTLGFTGPRVLRMVLGESVLLALWGAIAGVLAGAGMMKVLEKVAPFGALDLQPPVVVIALALALALGLVTGLIPAIGALRMRIVDAMTAR
ncbi:MAG: ABC transporter permease [Caulobacterales bacterium]